MSGMLKNHCAKLLHCLLTESFLVFCEPTQLFLSLRASFTDTKNYILSKTSQSNPKLPFPIPPFSIPHIRHEDLFSVISL